MRTELMDKLIKELLNSYDDIDNVLNYHNIPEISMEEFEYLESKIFQCDSCGQWCGIAERVDTGLRNICEYCDCWEREVYKENEE